MARGGVETKLALAETDIPIDEATAVQSVSGLDPTGLGPDMNVPPIMSNDGMGDYSTNTTGAPPPIPGAQDPTGDQPQRRGMGPLDIGGPTLKGPNLNPKYRYTQNDFYGNNPNITFTDPRGVQMYVPSFGEVPYAVLGSQIQGIKAERAQNKKALQDLLNPKFDRTAPQYEAEFAAYANKAIMDEVAAQTASFGGDRTKALDYLTNDLQGQARWAAKMREINAVGQEAKYVADDWADILDQNAKELLHLSPENKKLGEEIVRGYTALGTDKEPHLPDFLNKVKQGRRVIGREQYVKSFIIPAIDELAQDTETIEKPYWSGGRLIIPVKDRRNYDALIDSQARAMTEKGDFDTVSEAKQWLGERFQPDVKVQAIVRDPIQPRAGSSDDPKSSLGPIETGRGTLNIEEGPPSSVALPDGLGAGPTLRRADIERRPYYEITGGKKVQSTPKNFVGLDGSPITMRPTYVVNQGGQLYAQGELVGKGQTVTYTTMEENSEGELEEVTKTVDTTKGTAPVLIPESGNEATFIEVFGPNYKKGFSGSAKTKSTKDPLGILD